MTPSREAFAALAAPFPPYRIACGHGRRLCRSAR
jgi:hypothetical protein